MGRHAHRPAGGGGLPGHADRAPDSTPVTERLFADGAGRVVQVGRTRGTVRANGAAFDVPEVHVWTVAGGRVRRFEAFLDTAALRAAMDRPVAWLYVAAAVAIVLTGAAGWRRAPVPGRHRG